MNGNTACEKLKLYVPSYISLGFAAHRSNVHKKKSLLFSLWLVFRDRSLSLDGYDKFLSELFCFFKLANLTEHLSKVEKDIEEVIRDPDFQGLGIIDWEFWRPIFNRNWDKLSIYRFESIIIVC